MAPLGYYVPEQGDGGLRKGPGSRLLQGLYYLNGCGLVQIHDFRRLRDAYFP